MAEAPGEAARRAAGEMLSAAAAGDAEAFGAAARRLPEGQAPGFREPTNQRNALHVAAMAGSAAVCRAAVADLGFDPDELDKEGRTPVSLAAATCSTQAVAVLIENGCHLNIPSRNGATPLNYAAASGSMELLELLIKHGAHVNAASSMGGAPLLWAISTGKADAVRALVAAKADVNVSNGTGASALAMAAASGLEELVEVLLEAGADLAGHEEHGISALHAAASAGKLTTIAKLLEAGADPEAQDKKGHKPVHEAAMNGHKEAAKVLLAKTSPDPNVLQADWTLENLMKAAEEAKEKAKAESTTATSLEVPAPEDPNPELAVTIKKQGDTAFRSKNFPTALEKYTNSLRHDTSKATVWANRSATLLQMGQAEEALRDAQIARSIDKNYAKGWYREGKAAQALCRWEDAACAYFEGHCVEPSNKDLEVSFKYAVQEGKKASKGQAGAK